MDHLNRIRKFCEGTNCQLFSYVGDSDWVSVVTDQDGNLKFRYLYANGKPLRVDVPYGLSINRWYYRYNARGDAAGFTSANGDGGTDWKQFGAWGDSNSFMVNPGSAEQSHYHWNAVWGYMQFPTDLNFHLHDGLDMGLYYAHGRWYNQDTGLWLSPNAKGDYLYGGSNLKPVFKG